MHRKVVTLCLSAFAIVGCQESLVMPGSATEVSRAGSLVDPLWEAVELPEGSVVVGMNNAGQVAGHVNGAGFLWQDGQLTALDLVPSKINDLGQVVGEVPGSCCNPHFAIWDAGSIRPVDIDYDRFFGFNFSISAFSDAGVVVGSADFGGPFLGAWKWSDGRFSLLPSPRNASDDVFFGGLNERGWVSGTSNTYDTRFTLATRWRDTVGDLLPFLDPADDISGAAAMNARGDIVGSSGLFEQQPGGIPGHCCVTRLRAVIWQNGQVVDLGAYPGAQTSARLVNQRGQVVGTANLPEGRRVFLWTQGIVRELETPNFTVEYTPIAINEPGEILGGQPAFESGEHVVVWVDGRAHRLGPGRPIAITNGGDVLVQGSQPTPQGRRPTRGIIWRRVR